jgi:5-methylthioadenosine/S-adenosylhomocysteine deaminase
VSYSTSPVGEARRPGVTQLAEMLSAGVNMSLSIDHTTTFDADMFKNMGILFSLNMHRLGDKFKLTTRRLVQLATIDGALDLGLGNKTGSLTPGKRADLILIRTNAPNMAPIGDPYDALVQLAQPSNIDTVMVDGRILRRGGQYTGLDFEAVVGEATEAASALKARAG